MNIDDLMKAADYTPGEPGQPHRVNEAGAMLVQYIRKAEAAKAVLARAYAGCQLLDVLNRFPSLVSARLVIEAESRVDDNGVWFTDATLTVEDLVHESSGESQAELAPGADPVDESMVEEIEECLQDIAIDLYDHLGGDGHEPHDIVIRLRRDLLASLPADAMQSGARFTATLEQRGCIELLSGDDETDG